MRSNSLELKFNITCIRSTVPQQTGPNNNKYHVCSTFPNNNKKKKNFYPLHFTLLRFYFFTPQKKYGANYSTCIKIKEYVIYYLFKYCVYAIMLLMEFEGTKNVPLSDQFIMVSIFVFHFHHFVFF